ncbi:HU family DNA-binding protein [Pseudomarimonas arenosa]|uniref:HU family DNA-binding protein n=1 Tax=Pseudomarimonas arenosa TaxID=2774145 RepID=A0AAW3ZRM3_9GAMM|nr:HU family DNA-binding protein [Pseudomarimonas arenosa]MBD8526896.1 HU family DNA-binding protein [Pseudomarimonas arenosa]
MAAKKSSKKVAAKPAAKPAAKAAAKPKAAKAITEPLNKSGLVSYLVEASGVASKDVKAVMGALEQAVSSSISKKGAGAFVLPGLLKITSVKVAAKPKRKGIDPFTKQERVFAAKPATTKVKIRPLKKLKEAAL